MDISVIGNPRVGLDTRINLAFRVHLKTGVTQRYETGLSSAFSMARDMYPTGNGKTSCLCAATP